MITVTDSAVEHLRGLLEEKGAPEANGLRLFIQRGGCAGMQYAMKIGAPAPGDSVVERDGVRFFVAEDSLPYLRNAEVDYVDGLNDAGFRIHNPNAARSCGCGTSFEPADASAGSELEAAPDPGSCRGEEESSDSSADP